MTLEWLLAPRPVPVQLGTSEYRVPALPAARWLRAMSGPTLLDVVPGLLEAPDRVRVANAMVLGRLTARQCADAAKTTITTVSARKWWEAMRLVGSVDQPRGELYGHLMLAGIDPEQCSIGAWCSALHTLLVRNLDDKGRMKYDASMMLPPDGDFSQVEGWDTGVPAGFSADLPPGTA